jgi:hypothetical protein
MRPVKTFLVYALSTLALVGVIWLVSPFIFGERPPMPLIVTMVTIGLTISAIEAWRA